MALAIREYVARHGQNPFRQWLARLDLAVRARIQARVQRFETGNLGDHKNVGGGVWEARLPFGAGYRIYFGRDGHSIIVLLAGGDKSSQAQDITCARGYWQDYVEARRHGTT